MGVSMGTSGFYVVVSLVPNKWEDDEDGESRTDKRVMVKSCV